MITSENVTLISEELNLTANISSIITLDELDISDTSISFSNVSYNHPLGCRLDFLNFYNITDNNTFIFFPDILPYSFCAGGSGGNWYPSGKIDLLLCNETYKYIEIYGADTFAPLTSFLEQINEDYNTSYTYNQAKEYIDNWQGYCPRKITEKIITQIKKPKTYLFLIFILFCFFLIFYLYYKKKKILFLFLQSQNKQKIYKE